MLWGFTEKPNFSRWGFTKNHYTGGELPKKVGLGQIADLSAALVKNSRVDVLEGTGIDWPQSTPG